LEVNKKGTLVSVFFPEEGIEFIGSYIKDKDGVFKTELHVYADIPSAGGRVRLHRSHPDLLEDWDVKKLIDLLDEKTSDYKQYYWGSLVDKAKDAIIDTYREGEPAEVMDDLDAFEPRIYDIRPMFVKGVANLMWAPGGSAKSYFALLSCVMIDKGLDLMGLRARKGVALYLDWEETNDVFRQRLKAVHEGLGLSPDSGIVYKKMTGSLANNIETVSQIVAKHNVTYMVVDSVGAALGGNGVDQQVVEDYFAAGNLLGITWVSIDHANRAGETTGNYQIHGSAFKYARARQVYEFKKVQEHDSGAIEIMIHHRKANDSAIKSPRGYKIAFDSERYYIAEADDYDDRLSRVTFESLAWGDASDEFLNRESIGKICHELVKARGESNLTRLAMDVSRIKDVDSITEDTIQASIENYVVRQGGANVNPIVLHADGVTVSLVTAEEEVEEWNI